MTPEEYIYATREATSFLTRIFSEDWIIRARIMIAQAEHKTQFLIKTLELVIGKCNELIEGLKEIEKEE